jgi:hypothetical protein
MRSTKLTNREMSGILKLKDIFVSPPLEEEEEMLQCASSSSLLAYGSDIESLILKIMRQ